MFTLQHATTADQISEAHALARVRLALTAPEPDHADGDVEYASAADWPAWTDAHVWEPTVIGHDLAEPVALAEPFEPSEADREWWARQAEERAALEEARDWRSREERRLLDTYRPLGLISTTLAERLAAGRIDG